MKSKVLKCIFIIFSLLILDYINLPSTLGVKITNINLDFWMGFLNVSIVIILYLITYKRIDKRTIEREENKKEISLLLINECYKECLNYVEFLSQEMIEKYIIPKMDCNSTNNEIISNLKEAPFYNENTIMDLVKDGQLNKEIIKKYFYIKSLFSQYITIRIICFDKSNLYESLKNKLFNEINIERKNLI